MDSISLLSFEIQSFKVCVSDLNLTFDFDFSMSEMSSDSKSDSSMTSTVTLCIIHVSPSLNNPANAVKCLERVFCDKIVSRMGVRLSKDGLLQRRQFRRTVVDSDSFDTVSVPGALLFKLRLTRDELDQYLKRFRVKVDGELIIGLSDKSRVKEHSSFGVKLSGLNPKYFSAPILDTEIMETCGVRPLEYRAVPGEKKCLIAVFDDSEAAKFLVELGDIDIGVDIVQCSGTDVPAPCGRRRVCFLCGGDDHLVSKCKLRVHCRWCTKSGCKIKTCVSRKSKKKPTCSACTGVHPMGTRACPLTARVTTPKRKPKKSESSRQMSVALYRLGRSRR